MIAIRVQQMSLSRNNMSLNYAFKTLYALLIKNTHSEMQIIFYLIYIQLIVNSISWIMLYFNNYFENNLLIFI